MQNTESGRKLNQAMASTGRAVATTSKAVGMIFIINIINVILHWEYELGGAISQAKGAFSSWWSNLLVSPEPVQKGVEAITENGTTELVENGHDGCTEQKLDDGTKAPEVNQIESVENHKTGEIHTVWKQIYLS